MRKVFETVVSEVRHCKTFRMSTVNGLTEVRTQDFPGGRAGLSGVFAFRLSGASCWYIEPPIYPQGLPVGTEGLLSVQGPHVGTDGLIYVGTKGLLLAEGL